MEEKYHPRPVPHGKRKAKVKYAHSKLWRAMHAGSHHQVINRLPPFRMMCRERFRNTMRGDFTINYDSGSTSESHYFVFNDVLDPMGAEGAVKFAGYDVLNAMYKNCLVHGAKIRATFFNFTADQLTLGSFPWHDGQDVPTGATFARAGTSKLYLIPDSVTAASCLPRTPNPTINLTFNCKRLTGYKEYDKLDDGNPYALIDGTSPTKKVQTYFIVSSVGGGNIDANSFIRIECWVDCTWWGWQTSEDVS